MWIFYQQFVGKFDNPQNSKLVLIFILKFMFKWPYLHLYVTDSNNDGSKFKLDCVKVENGYVLLIFNIRFKLRLINFVYFFL